MNAGAVLNSGGPWLQIKRFYESGLWSETPSAGGPLGALGIRLLRLVIVSVRGAQDRLLNLHATGLVYATLLSVVPFIAVAFSVLKAFGAHYRLEPLIARALAPLGSQGAELTERVVQFVSRMNVGVLGALGLAGLFYTVLSLIERIEDALNSIWNVRRSRGLQRKFSDYLSVLLVGPVLVFAAFAIIASLRSSWLVQEILRVTRLETVTVAVAGHAAPLVMLAAAFTFLYRFLPYTRVELGAAAIGGITAAALWQVAGVVFAKLVAGSASYTAVYSSFAVLVLSLIWLRIAWLIVLVGAQVAYADQHPSSYAASRRGDGLPSRERVGLTALVEVTRRYLSGKPPLRIDGLAAATGAPVTVLEELVDGFVAHGILARGTEPEGLILARPPEQVDLVEVLDVVRGPDSGDASRPGSGPNAVSDVLRQRNQALREALDGVTLRSLVSRTRSPEAVVADLGQYRRSAGVDLAAPPPGSP
jgi:membrane protein